MHSMCLVRVFTQRLRGRSVARGYRRVKKCVCVCVAQARPSCSFGSVVCPFWLQARSMGGCGALRKGSGKGAKSAQKSKAAGSSAKAGGNGKGGMLPTGNVHGPEDEGRAPGKVKRPEGAGPHGPRGGQP